RPGRRGARSAHASRSAGGSIIAGRDRRGPLPARCGPRAGGRGARAARSAGPSGRLMPTPRPAAVHRVLRAAGRSSGVGSANPRRGLDGETLVERAVRVLLEGGCAGVIAVVRAQDDATARLAHAAGARVVVNDDPHAQQVDSLRLALRELPDDAVAAAGPPVDAAVLRPRPAARP